MTALSTVLIIAIAVMALLELIEGKPGFLTAFRCIATVILCMWLIPMIWMM